MNIFDPRQWYKPIPKSPKELGLVTAEQLHIMGFRPYVQNKDFYVRGDEYYLVDSLHSNNKITYYKKLER